nr:hypothetical protein CFP56_60551 [Quercus suber]
MSKKKAVQKKAAAAAKRGGNAAATSLKLAAASDSSMVVDGFVGFAMVVIDGGRWGLLGLPWCDREVQRNTVSSTQAATVSDQSPRRVMGEIHLQTTEEKVKEKGRDDLKEIDAALCGDTADTTNLHHAEQNTGMTKTLQTKVQPSPAQWEEDGSANHNGSQGEFNNNTMTLFGPHGLNSPATQAQVSPPSLFLFNMGLTSPTNSIKPKLKKHNQAILKKGRVGPAMQRKENNARRGIEMEKSNGLGMGTKMDIKQTEKSGKRKARFPLKVIPGTVENVKRNW